MNYTKIMPKNVPVPYIDVYFKIKETPLPQLALRVMQEKGKAPL